MIPSYIRKNYSGWTNHLGTVTTHEIARNEMGNRGSKSVVNYSNVYTTVKEQRVDGSWLLKNNLRYTLLTIERCYITSLLSNRILTKRTFCSNNLNSHVSNSKLTQMQGLINPNQITGFADAEGAFMIKIRKNSKLKTGWAIEPSFEISIHIKDLELLKQIRNFFGNISNILIKKDRNMCVFSVRSLEDITSKIIPHFDLYPLITQKRVDYLLFKTVILKMLQKDHLTKEGVEAIINIRSAMNLGLTPILKEAFPLSVPVQRPIVNNVLSSKAEHWVSGFTSGEGCFSISLIYNKDKTYVQLKYSVSQLSRDRLLLESFIRYFNCGHLAESRGSVYFYVVKFTDIYDKIIPFFNENKILGIKSEDYLNWCKVAELVKEKKHLTKDGLDQIIKIKEILNKKDTV